MYDLNQIDKETCFSIVKPEIKFPDLHPKKSTSICVRFQRRNYTWDCNFAIASPENSFISIIK